MSLRGMELKKYIAIRYNAPTGFKPSRWKGTGRANLDPVWLVERLALFDTYCAPSLENQSMRDFTVLVAFDADTHENYIRMVCDCVAGIDVRPVLVRPGEGHNERFNAFIQADTDAAFVCVARLDSDDALAPGFMERVDHYARREIGKGAVSEQPLYIAFPQGQNFDVATGRYIQHDYVTSAFGALVETRSPTMKGVYSDHHQEMSARYNTVVASAHGALWCIVVHDNNAANVLRGKPIDTPSFTVGRTGVFPKLSAVPDAKVDAALLVGRTAKASRTLGNLMRFISGQPLILSK
ncbi:glycosyltransferase [Mesorhizobium sp. B4-1-3]|uniref:glycosyltransferase n=1 Tax=Mesorhizobium sp. B4-1-3 TaxID=2589889 RepID=UPI001125D072|nr:glycosyltransferase [Mesorhizobium sp. B4-1-3]